jgi:hypothetical protein
MDRNKKAMPSAACQHQTEAYFARKFNRLRANPPFPTPSRRHTPQQPSCRMGENPD